MPGISTDEIYMQQETAYEAFLNQALNGKEKYLVPLLEYLENF